ncbi:MAG: NFACT RNA binding domain-containing protein [archaeon]
MNSEESQRQWYEKYRWFFTSSGKLVVGGKNAVQNEEVMNFHIENNDLIMHTEAPGSPFAILKSGKAADCNDIEETSVFCASFSRAWRQGKKRAEVHIFSKEQVSKEKSQKQGTFTILGKIRKAKAELRLAISIQKGKLRAVPETAADEIFCIIKPGVIPKDKTAREISKILREQEVKVSTDEILNSLPSGKFKIEKS